MFKFSCLSLCKLLRDGRAPCLHNNLPNSFANSFTTDSTCTLSTTPQTRGPQLFHSLIIHFANCLSCANCSPTLFRYLVISGKLSWNVANTTYMITRQTCSSPFESRRVVEPLELNVPSLQVFFWMPREQSFVEIAQKADIIPSSAAGQRYVLKGVNCPLQVDDVGDHIILDRLSLGTISSR